MNDERLQHAERPWYRQQREPKQRSFLRDHIGNFYAVLRLSGAVARLDDIAVIAERNAYITVCKRLDIVR